ncbi:MAG: RraA family protein [Kiloniellales bacterium]
MRAGTIKRPAKKLIDGFRGLATSTIANALDDVGVRGIITGLKPIAPGLRCVGPAVTVREMTGARGSFPASDFRVGHMIDAAQAGDVIVVDNGGNPVSTWGGLASYAARLKGLAGLVVDGGVRDADEIAELGFPVFSRHLVPTPGRGRIRVEAINVEVTIDGVLVRPGDIVVADVTGIAVVPAERAAEVLKLARRNARDDRQARAELERGLTFTEALGRFKNI